MIFSCLIDDDFFCRVMLSLSGPPYPPRRSATEVMHGDDLLLSHRLFLLGHALSKRPPSSPETQCWIEERTYCRRHDAHGASRFPFNIERGGEGGIARGRRGYADDLEAPVWVPATFAVPFFKYAKGLPPIRSSLTQAGSSLSKPFWQPRDGEGVAGSLSRNTIAWVLLLTGPASRAYARNTYISCFHDAAIGGLHSGGPVAVQWRSSGGHSGGPVAVYYLQHFCGFL